MKSLDGICKHDGVGSVWAQRAGPTTASVQFASWVAALGLVKVEKIDCLHILCQMIVPL